MRVFGATSGGTSGGTSGSTSGGTYHGTGPGSGTAIPASLQLHIEDDTMAFEAFRPSSFGDQNLHPDYWAMARVPAILRELDVDDADFANALAPYWDSQTLTASIPTEDGSATVEVAAKEDLAVALSDREQVLREYGAEIVDQAGSFHHYYYNVLSLQAATHPCSARLISVGMNIAATIGMYWKNEVMRPRPVQVWPGLLPFIATPAHPSFPSNHAAQSHLISLLISMALAKDSGVDHADTEIGRYLFNLSGRIATNRERAGVHFSSDTWAGIALAEVIAVKLINVGIVEELMNEVRGELEHLAPTSSPVDPA